MTSTPNDTANELLNPIFQDEEDDDTSFQEFSHVQSNKQSSVTPVRNSIKSPIDLLSSSSSEQVATLHTSSLSMNLSMTQSLLRPKARRPDGTEPVVLQASSSQPTSNSSSSKLPWNHLTFPRALTSRGKLNVTITSKRQLPSLPALQVSPEQKRVPDEQFDTNQLYQLLDHLDEHSHRSSPVDFISMLDQLSLSTVLDQSAQPISQESTNAHSASDDSDEAILPEFFDHPLPSAQEKRFYTTFTIPLSDPTTLRLYVMTCSIVQFSASIYLPYSVLAGRRPHLASSKQTSFTPVRSKRKNYTCQVTAVESSLNLPELKPNDILLKVRPQTKCMRTPRYLDQ